jgi:hypothetical protein
LKPLFPRYILNLPENISNEGIEKIREQFTKFIEGECTHIYAANGVEIDITQTEQFKELVHVDNELFLAKSWLGKLLGAIGEPTPYKSDGMRENVSHIEPPADTQTEILQFDSHIQAVDRLRERISLIMSRFLVIMDNIDPYKLHLHIESETLRNFSLHSSAAGINIYTHLSQARFWLGAELGRIRLESIKEQSKNQDNETVS